MNRRVFRCLAAITMLAYLLSCTMTAAAQISYRTAGREEGVRLLTGNAGHYGRFTQNDLDYRMQKKGATLEEWLDFAAEQVLEFTEADRRALDKSMAAIEAILDQNGYVLPELDEIVFVKTTMHEEGDCGAYTSQNQIYLGEELLAYMRSGVHWQELFAEYMLCHEMFHCLTRGHAAFREDMYKIIGFTVREEELELNPELRSAYISNPDVEHHNAYAAFTINGEKRDCSIVAITSKPFDKPGDYFADTITAVLVPIDQPDIFYTPEEAADFWDVLGRNTSYVIDPEECMADNFGFALIYGKTKLNGEPFKTPQILDAIQDYLKNGVPAEP